MSYVKDKDKNMILEEMLKVAEVGSQVFEQQKAAIMVRCTEDIEKVATYVGSSIQAGVANVDKSIATLNDLVRESAKSSAILSRRLLWLNIILTAATVVGAVATLIQAVK